MAIRAIVNLKCLKSMTAPHTEKQLQFSLPREKKKPSKKQTQQCRLHADTTFCAVYLEDDHSEDDFVNWLECCFCQMWLHMKCAHCESSSAPYITAGTSNSYFLVKNFVFVFFNNVKYLRRCRALWCIVMDPHDVVVY